MVLLKGSSPMVTFEVSACSLRCISVPPIVRLLESSYSQLTPNMVLRCIPYSVSDSSDTFTLVPASIML